VTARIDAKTAVIAIAAVTLAAAAILYAIGHPLICECGYIKFWHGVTYSPENSQHLADWYTPSHVIHGLLFYAFLWLVARNWSVSARAVIATLIEAGWEILENTPLIINRYREATISLDYFGDSVLNSVMDIAWMLLGFFIAARLPVWVSVALVVALELFVGYFIRDNLTLNIIMLLYPLDAIRSWQAGG
jgi:hypothetical protein